MPATPFLLLRLEAPLMAFGGPMVDQIGRTRPFPGQAQITGLLANALGWDHRDFAALQVLQARLRFAAAVVDVGEMFRDYQTVDLGQRHLSGTGWTTRGRPEHRAGASADTTHIRYRWFVADGRVLVALTLVPAEPAPDLADLAAALRHPARPLFIGRKPCLPTAPILLAELEAVDASAALRVGLERLAADDERLTGRQSVRTALDVEMDGRWPVPDTGSGRVDSERIVDGRDWRNQLHDHERPVHRFRLDVREGVLP